MNKKQILEGSRAIALTVNNIRPDVVSAYPITPQTHIVEDLAKFKAEGQADFEYVRAESEFAAASIVLGASAAGSRTYSATSSQGLLLMTEVIYNIAGMRLPIVMTCSNRAISGPINIWNDHSDVMSVRDSGWIQLFAADHQEAVYQHILAYRLAEELRLPVMVNVDGFVLTHTYEPVYIPSKEEIASYLPTYRPESGNYLDPENPVTLGAFFTPQHYLETRESLHSDLMKAVPVILKRYKELRKSFPSSISGQIDNGLFEYFGPKKPETVIVALGSVTGTIREAIKNDHKTGLLKLKVYRPFPAAEIAKQLKGSKNIAVIEKAISLGQAGPLYTDLKAELPESINVSDYIVGLGGRDVTEKMITQIVKKSAKKNSTLRFIG